MPSEILWFKNVIYGLCGKKWGFEIYGKSDTYLFTSSKRNRMVNALFRRKGYIKVQA